MSDLLKLVADYYDERLRTYGETAQGVDWNGDASQRLRFVELARLLPVQGGFSLNDLGCGYGALYDYIQENYSGVLYQGYDVSQQMIAAARERLGMRSDVYLACTAEPNRIADYTLASGIFNVRFDRPEKEWRAYIEATLEVMNRVSTRGFAFNCLTSYSDMDKMRDHLYYASPTYFFDLCKTRYARNVSLLHDYGLYEFTLIVRKNQ